MLGATRDSVLLLFEAVAPFNRSLLRSLSLCFDESAAAASFRRAWCFASRIFRRAVTEEGDRRPVREEARMRSACGLMYAEEVGRWCA
jgi:hypothetical protein